jgi:protein involved in polysaccharide export with SLBB domain
MNLNRQGRTKARTIARLLPGNERPREAGHVAQPLWGVPLPTGVSRQCSTRTFGVSQLRRALNRTTLHCKAVSTVFALAVIAGPVSGTEHSQDSQIVAPENLPQTLTGPYQVQVGDQLYVGFFNTPQLDQTRTVGPDGDIFLPLVGRVHTVGRTVDEITDELKERYAKELVEPQITVSVQQYAGMSVYVGGEVNSPGVLPYRGELTAVQAIMDAGGFKTTASLGDVILIRKGPDAEPVGTKINVKDILHKGKFDEDVTLGPADIIFVPRSKVANVNLFVEQIIRNNIPIPVSLSFGVWKQR